ncbi:hypothetical protein [Candidatus Poriferisocius sp.]|uniref:hypothetical protein n=1 Tax=Candidatus Poriferisocius sp. TaxID=3101276 RepID=UPI003B01CF40
MGENRDWRMDISRAGADLHELLSTGMPADESGEWMRCLEEKLGQLSRALIGFRADCAHGLYDECIELAPRLVSQVNKLRAEQAQIQTSVREHLDRLQSQRPGPGLCRSMTELVHRVDQLSHNAVDLVYSAYDTDLGGPG